MKFSETKSSNLVTIKAPNMDMDELIEDTLKNPMITGVTFSGGDPLEQSDKLIYMIKN